MLSRSARILFVDSKKPRVHGNPDVLKSDSIWYAGTKSLAIILASLGGALLLVLLLLGIPPYYWITYKLYAIAAALLLASLFYWGNHYFYKGSNLEMEKESYKFNRVRDFRTRYTGHAKGKLLPAPEEVIRKLAPLLPDCRACSFRNCIIIIGNNGKGSAGTGICRVYVFVYKTEVGVTIHVVQYPLLKTSGLDDSLSSPRPPYPDESDLKRIALNIYRILADAPITQPKDDTPDSIKLA
jgi:hypothetical protein